MREFLTRFRQNIVRFLQPDTGMGESVARDDKPEYRKVQSLLRESYLEYRSARSVIGRAETEAPVYEKEVGLVE